MLDYQPHKVLVTVKTYPNPSRKYTETVCVAGMDLQTHEWLRLYPIPFRDLAAYQRFKKYSIIAVKMAKTPQDNRPESRRVESGSIHVEGVLDTKRSWSRRREVVLANGHTSLCALKREQKSRGTSLGVVKPATVEFRAEPTELPDAELRKAYYAQSSLFGSTLTSVEPIPYRFSYRFTCPGEAACPGHDLSIVDWELMQSYRSWRIKYRDERVLLAKIEQKWQDEMFSPMRDSYLYVGNVFLHQQSFLVLGVFWPPCQWTAGSLVVADHKARARRRK